ncbi:MAG: hypothetical protein JWQ35_537, partial [Bacteriovoracaceae bacterium]|nr:hypothetical protein [Bacteriovoracaceae bacterium]
MYWKKLIKLKLQYFNISAFILFSSLAIRTFVDYFSSLKDTFENKWPVEYNSFYYLVELREYASTGSGYYSPFLPFFFVLSKIQHFFGLSDIETYNSVVIASFLIFAGALAAMSYDKKRPFVAPAMIFILLSSRMIFFAHYSYLKQAAGVAFFASYLGFVHLAKTVDRRSIKNILFGFAFFSIVIASAFHKF